MKKVMVGITVFVLSVSAFAQSNPQKDVLLESSPTSTGHKVTVMEPFKVDPALLGGSTQAIPKPTPVKLDKSKKPVAAKGDWLNTTPK